MNFTLHATLTFPWKTCFLSYDVVSGSDEGEQHLLLDIESSGTGSLPKWKFRVKNLSRATDTGVPILSGVSVDIPKGQVVGIIGPSGSGKSTLLRALNRMWEPDNGSVFLDGTDICDLEVLSLRRRVGMLFQLPVLFEGTYRSTIL